VAGRCSRAWKNSASLFLFPYVICGGCNTQVAGRLYSSDARRIAIDGGVFAGAVAVYYLGRKFVKISAWAECRVNLMSVARFLDQWSR